MFNLQDRVAIVTGGNGGIGLGMAKGLAAAGASILVVGRNEAKTNSAVEELINGGASAAAFCGDVSDVDVCEAMAAECVSKFGGLDIFVANAGINRRMLPQEYSVKDWNDIITTNLSSVLYGANAVRPAMLKRGGGKIITIGSMLSIFGLGMASAYAASKGGVVQLTKSLASAWALENIQVNCILPGWISTELTKQARIDMVGLHERVVKRTPAARWGEPKDLAGIGVFLASSASDFVTGTAIPVDGGYSAQG